MSAVLFVGISRVRRRLKSYAGVALLLGLTAGLSMTAIAGARRTQSAYPRFLRSVNASTLSVILQGGYDADATATVAALPEVVSSRTYVGFNVNILDVDGKPDFTVAPEISGTFDGRYFDQDRFTPTQGRAADPSRADEVEINEYAAQNLDLHLGQRIELGAYSLAQYSDPSFASNPPAPMMRTTVTIVGIGLLPEEILQDDADRDERLLLTPAFSELARPYLNYGVQGLVLRHGDADLRGLRTKLESIFPPDSVGYRTTSVDTLHALRAVRPLSIALGLFGLIAGVAGLVLVAQAINRLLRLDQAEQESLHAFGARRSTIAGAAIVAPFLAIAAGVVFAVAFAIATSPVMPIGPVGRVEVDRGTDIDLTVLGLGVLVVGIILGTVTSASVWRQLPHRRRSRNRNPAGTSMVASVAASLALSPAAVTGMQAASAPPRASNDVPTRSAVGGTIIAVAALVGAFTFSASLSSLIHQPHLYGWNWQAAVSAANGYGNLDLDSVHNILDHDPQVAEWSGVYFGSAAINDHEVPLLGVEPSAPVAPSMLHGRLIENSREAVLGATTADQLNVGIGDLVSLAGGTSAQSLRVVGIATFPTIGKIHAVHTSLGVGAMVAHPLVPGSDLDITGTQRGDFGPNVLFVRFRPGTNVDAATDHLREIMQPLTGFAGLDVLSVQRPAEIVNTGSIGNAPILLGACLMFASLVSFALAVGASTRQRRRELAVLRTLGFTSRQLVSTLSWQASTLIAVGLVVGIPLGVVAGRDLWGIFADQLDVVSRPRVPVPLVVGLVVAALLVANVTAVLFGNGARRLRPGAALRAGD